MASLYKGTHGTSVNRRYRNHLHVSREVRSSRQARGELDKLRLFTLAVRTAPNFSYQDGPFNSTQSYFPHLE